MRDCLEIIVTQVYGDKVVYHYTAQPELGNCLSKQITVAFRSSQHAFSE